MTGAELSGCISIFKARPHSEKAVTLVFSPCYLGLNFLFMSELCYFKRGHSSKSDLNLGYFQFH